MMNDTARLAADLAAARALLHAKAEAIHAFRTYLDAEKFKGIDSRGSPKAWIATPDVHGWLTLIADAGGEV